MFGTLLAHFISYFFFRIAAFIRAHTKTKSTRRYEYEWTFEFQMRFLSRCILLCFRCSGRLSHMRMEWNVDDMRDATINAHSNRSSERWNMSAPKMHDSLQRQKREQTRDPECDNRIESTTYLKCTLHAHCTCVCDIRMSVELCPRGYKGKKWFHWVQWANGMSSDSRLVYEMMSPIQSRTNFFDFNQKNRLNIAELQRIIRRNIQNIR